MFSNALQAEMHKKYDLRPRKKEVVPDNNLHLRSLVQVSPKKNPKNFQMFLR
jgi:hypothetical protein